MTTPAYTEAFSLRPIGFVSSALKHLEDCPLQEAEGAPAACLHVYDAYASGLKNIGVGDKLVVLTWLHLANRDVLMCYKRNLVGSEEFGVFSTRSPDRPNPIGLHTVTVVETVNETTIKVFPLEVLDGTPVVDVKPFL